MISLCVTAVFSSFLLMSLYCVEARKRRLRRTNWEELLDSLAPVKAEWLVLVALEAREAPQHQRQLLSQDLWGTLGGWPGVRGMLVNAERLNALAVNAHHWNEQRAVDISEAMRMESRRLQSAALNAIWKHVIGIASTSDLQQAAKSYFEMTEGLLELYESRAIGVQVRVSTALRPYLGPPVPTAAQPFT